VIHPERRKENLKKIEEMDKLKPCPFCGREVRVERYVEEGRRWRTLLDILGIAVPTAASGYWLYKGMKFEEEVKIHSSRTTQWFSGIARLFKKG
jgi:hypothetical protein